MFMTHYRHLLSLMEIQILKIVSCSRPLKIHITLSTILNNIILFTKTRINRIHRKIVYFKVFKACIPS